jgi:hypothetical protein
MGREARKIEKHIIALSHLGNDDQVIAAGVVVGRRGLWRREDDLKYAIDNAGTFC